MVNGGISNNVTPLLINPFTHAYGIYSFIMSMGEIVIVTFNHTFTALNPAECVDLPVFKGEIVFN